jgi:TolB-like protein/DNA-binding winged helix-turn-helix (wHTH) protein/Flp pilus assembly protein TadD
MTQPTDNATTGRLRCGDLTLDVDARRVERCGQIIELGTLNFDLLRVLAESAPNVVTQDELAERVWGRHFVSPENIAQRVMLLRQSLADDAGRPRYIEAVRGKGYRLIPKVETLPAVRAHHRWRLRFAAVAVLILAVSIAAAVSLWWPLGPQPPRDTVPNAIAVLPLENLSPDPDDAYLASGLHAEIISQLSRAGVPAIARTSVQRYAGSEDPIGDIAADLRVETVLEGTVFYADNRVRITMALIDTDSGATLWSDSYDRPLDDVFAIQADIAASVALALGPEQAAARMPDGNMQAARSPEAAALYLRALDAGQVINSVDTQLQHAYLDLALEFDPDFANAYALKADLYALEVVDSADRGSGGRANEDSQAELERLALENARKALALDADSARAYAAIARVHRLYWRWADALRANASAYERSPSDVTALSNYSELLSLSGRHELAIRLAKRIVELDPTSPAARWGLGIRLAEAHRHDEAAVTLAEATRMAPASAAIRHWQGRVEAARDHSDAALELLRTAERLGQNALSNPTLTAGLLYSYARAGADDDAERLFRSLNALADRGPVGAGTWALAYLAIDDPDTALKWLRAAVAKIADHVPDAGFLNLMTIKTNLMDDPVLEEARFVELRNRIGATD